MKNKLSINEKKIKYTKIFLIIIIGLVSYFLVRNISIEQIKNWVLINNKWAAIIYIITFIILPIFFFPVPVIVVAGGSLFGLVKGSIYTFMAVIVNTTIMYFLGRFLFKDFVNSFVENHVSEKIKNALFSKNQKVLSLVSFIIRLSPIFSYNLVNYISGITEIKFIPYILTTIIGVLPGIIVFINIGENVLKIGSKEFFVSLLFLFILVIISAIISKLFLKDSVNKEN